MKRHSISVRVNLLILLLAIIIGGGLVTAAYLNNSRQVDEFYMNRTSQISSTIASLVYGDDVSKLLKVLLTDEYQTLRTEAEEPGLGALHDFNRDLVAVEPELLESQSDRLGLCLRRLF